MRIEFKGLSAQVQPNCREGFKVTESPKDGKYVVTVKDKGGNIVASVPVDGGESALKTWDGYSTTGNYQLEIAIARPDGKPFDQTYKRETTERCNAATNYRFGSTADGLPSSAGRPLTQVPQPPIPNPFDGIDGRVVAFYTVLGASIGLGAFIGGRMRERIPFFRFPERPTPTVPELQRQIRTERAALTANEGREAVRLEPLLNTARRDLENLNRGLESTPEYQQLETLRVQAEADIAAAGVPRKIGFLGNRRTETAAEVQARVNGVTREHERRIRAQRQLINTTYPAVINRQENLTQEVDRLARELNEAVQDRDESDRALRITELETQLQEARARRTQARRA